MNGKKGIPEKSRLRSGKEAGQPASFPPLCKNQVETVTVSDVNNLGMGICRVRGTAVFVAGGVTGDVAEIGIIKVARSYAVARIRRLLTPSPLRQSPACTSAGRCGGCVYQHLTYDAEKELKENYVRTALRKAGLADLLVSPLLSAGETEGYRNKVQYPVAEDGSMGYYAVHSHTIIPCNRCSLQARALDAPLAAVKELLLQFPVVLKHLYLRHAKGTGEVMVCLVSPKRSFPKEAEFCQALRQRCPEVTSILLNCQPEETNVILGKEFRTLWGTPYLEDVLCGLRFRIHAGAFYQVNHDGAELLYRKAAELAQLQPGQRLADLFCGTGTIGLFCLSQCPEAFLTGIEVVPQAVENAKENARRNGLSHAEFLCGDANLPALASADVLILDPPRKGCAPDLIRRIGAIAVPRVVYVSCDPDTLARDLALFRKEGYRVGMVTPVDLFPRTGHVESVCLLTREPTAAQGEPSRCTAKASPSN